MSFDFATGLVSQQDEKVIEPEEIFRRQTSGKNLWLGQGDALRDWFNNREKNDILLSMDTGMGKTIVGLLIAHSIMNAGKGSQERGRVITITLSQNLNG
ncbi:MAG: DEAD/DEAH box helicase family protein [Campylobacterota bacterium]|nr:DEAD/DEAH box helicase family protein [Campylobacterota bacterium]